MSRYHQNMFTTREAYNQFRKEHREKANDKGVSFEDCLLFRAYMGKPLAAAVAPNTNPYILAYTLKRVLGKIEQVLIPRGDKPSGLKLDDEKRALFLKTAWKHFGARVTAPIHHQDLQAFDIELKLEQKAALQEAALA